MLQPNSQTVILVFCGISTKKVKGRLADSGKSRRWTCLSRLRTRWFVVEDGYGGLLKLARLNSFEQVDDEAIALVVVKRVCGAAQIVSEIGPVRSEEQKIDRVAVQFDGVPARVQAVRLHDKVLLVVDENCHCSCGSRRH